MAGDSVFSFSSMLALFAKLRSLDAADRSGIAAVIAEAREEAATIKAALADGKIDAAEAMAIAHGAIDVLDEAFGVAERLMPTNEKLAS